MEQQKASYDGLECEVSDLQAQLEKCQAELIQSRKEFVDFASVVAHDLRSPLLTISGYCDLLRHECKGQLSQSTDQYLCSIGDAVERMNRLLQDLLRYAQLPHSSCSSEKIALDQVLQDVINNLNAVIRESDAKIEIGELPAVTGDRTRFVQLFQNLIDNAIKFRGAQRPEIHIYSSRKANGHVLHVTDNGTGIDPKYHEEVFRILHRLPESRSIPGSGIGLAICKRIVDGYQGRIWIESSKDGGTTFQVWLPATE